MNAITRITPTAFTGGYVSTIVFLGLLFVAACKSNELADPKPETTLIEQMPAYTDGQEALFKQLGSTLHYPTSAKQDSLEGTVFLSYLVTKAGKVTDVKVAKGVRDDVDAEAIRAFRAISGKWNPGLKDGKPQAVKMTLPIAFKLSEGKAHISDKQTEAPKLDSDGVYMVVEQMPEFKGGVPGLMTYLSEQIKYPAEARDRGTYGTVFINFVVQPSGALTDIKVVKGIGNGCDEEAIRVVKNMPSWTPGQQNGQAVAVRYSLPIRFAL
jgi:TonB family protein